MQPQLSPLKNSGGLPRMDPFFSAGQQGASHEPQVMNNNGLYLFGCQAHVGSASSSSGQGTPYQGTSSAQGMPYNSGTHMFPYSESPSLAPQPHQRGPTPDYQPLFSVAGGSYMNQPSPDPSANLHSTHTNQDALMNACLQNVLECLDAAEKKIEKLENEGADKGKPSKKAATKNISNDHPILKPLIHPIFFELCDVDPSLSKVKRVEALIGIKPLLNGELFEILIEGGPKVWRPNWLGKFDSAVNAKFVQEVVDRVWNNEMNLCSTSSKGEIPDDDFSRPIITECAKGYWRNIHKQVDDKSTTEKVDKAEKRKITLCRCGRHQYVTKIRRKAALQYEKETGNKDAIAMIDTDYASETHTCDEATLSDDSKMRQQEAGVGKAAKKVIRFQWRHPDLVAFFRFLTLKSMQDDGGSDDEEAVEDPPTSEHPTKRRKTVLNPKKVYKKVFDVSPDHLFDRVPSSSKNSVLFANMVSAKWKESHPDMKLLEGVPWLKGFYERMKDSKELFAKDLTYLEELEDWHL
ncbi:uncharacterized protein HD556DRAFT_1436011 [Suillus plorans]|uniref:Uncharacterized protein n=1 Tax=Suillus plorans TaxID=116603 RepID=A0A9P7E458_9AGAM|nr:uncharacterized protein HD556DRAFT_1436011 [Suillus plorans]KAG1810293.1 hypothetical protein HD556DRAFT_1436011 [Suillus plorans]